MTIRLLTLAALFAAIAGATGCEGGASGRCDAIYSKLEQMPEFKAAGFSRYGNELRAAFAEGCAKLQEADLKCMENAKAANDLQSCTAGREVFESALARVGQPK